MSAKHSGIHSRTPWSAEPCGSMRPDEWLIIAPDGVQHEIKQIRTVGRVFDYGGAAEARENAAYIVRCVNSHEALVAALSKAEQAITFDMDNAFEDTEHYECIGALDAIRDALSLARGGGE